jgi:hypothetical protein
MVTRPQQQTLPAGHRIIRKRFPLVQYIIADNTLPGMQPMPENIGRITLQDVG